MYSLDTCGAHFSLRLHLNTLCGPAASEWAIWIGFSVRVTMVVVVVVFDSTVTPPAIAINNWCWNWVQYDLAEIEMSMRGNLPCFPFKYNYVWITWRTQTISNQIIVDPGWKNNYLNARVSFSFVYYMDHLHQYHRPENTTKELPCCCCCRVLIQINSIKSNPCRVSSL